MFMDADEEELHEVAMDIDELQDQVMPVMKE